MKTILTGLTLAALSALGLASKADASPMSPVSVPAALGGRHWHGGVGVGVSTGGGYYAQPSGYYTTEYRWVPTSVFAGYDAWNRPVYTTQYVQQAFQVWVPTVNRYYAPRYGYGHARPRVSVGFGLGFRF